MIESGNKAYEKEDYVEAEIDYRKALEKEADLVEGSFNLGGALYKQGKYDVSVEALEKVISASEPDDMKAKALFNRGNALFKRQMYPESVESYIQSLRLHPDDMAAKYNLTYALMKLREEMKQSSQPSQTDREEEEKGDKQGDPLGHQEENASGENPPPVERDEKASDEASKGDSIPRPEEHQISRSEAERILEALRNNEMEVQKKLRERSTAGIRVEKDW